MKCKYFKGYKLALIIRAFLISITYEYEYIDNLQVYKVTPRQQIELNNRETRQCIKL